MNENKTLSVIKTALILFIITALAAVLLAALNTKTAPLIAENSAAKQQDALRAVMSGAESFDELAVTGKMKEIAAEYGSEIDSIYAAKDDSGNNAGYCAVITTSGYDAGLQLAVGADNEGKVAGIEIIASNETPGLGQNAAKPDFKDQFTGKSHEIKVVKTGAADNEINAISGATMTSNGVARAVNTLLKIAEEER